MDGFVSYWKASSSQLVLFERSSYSIVDLVHLDSLQSR